MSVSGARPRRRRPSWYRQLPLWLQWFIPFGVAAALIAGLVLYSHHETADTPVEAPVTNPKAIAEENREATIIVGQDQAPHVVALAAGVTPIAGIKAAVVEYMSAQISHNTIDGPISGSRCTRRTGGSATRQLFSCDVTAASVSYPFEGVVEPTTKQITYCKRDAPPVPSMNIPLSKRCT